MPDLDHMRIVIAITATACGALAFLAYLWLLGMAAQQAKTAETAADAARGGGQLGLEATAPTLADAAELVKAFASLTDSLAKAGPALWSLLGSALFLLIACVAAGAFQGEAKPKPDTEASEHPAPSPDTKPGPTADTPVEENVPVH